MTNEAVHGRMLLGAIDSFMATVVHVRPHLAPGYRDALEAFAETWIDGGHPNQIDSLDEVWLLSYLEGCGIRSLTEIALREFFAWAKHEGLLERIPRAFMPLYPSA